MKKCPSGVICVENVTLLLLFIILLVLVTFIYSNSNSNSNSKDVIINNDINNKESSPNWLNNLLPSWPYNNLPRDVLLNPYAAPFRDERYFVTNPIRNVVPINVSTNIGSVDSTYRQMGIITPLNGASKDNILSLMGRPLFTNRDKWQYYTISNQHNNIKLPITFKGKSALNDYGVDKIFDGDTIYVEGYNEPFRVTVYENDTIKYLPFV
jgi:hypothetical protein